jgi:hypothetical protein
MIWQQAHDGQPVEIWTICAGNPPQEALPPLAAELHQRWQTGSAAVDTRRAEDIAACQAVNAGYRHFSMPDCIYRRLPDGEPLIYHNDELFVDRLDERTLPDIARVRTWLADQLPKRCRLVVPLTIGGHIDHHITRLAAEALGRPLWYYVDYPYVVRKHIRVRAWLGPGWARRQQAVSPAGLEAWQAGVASFTSQISTYWSGLEEMHAAMQDYLSMGGNALWVRSVRLSAANHS